MYGGVFIVLMQGVVDGTAEGRWQGEEVEQRISLPLRHMGTGFEFV